MVRREMYICIQVHPDDKAGREIKTRLQYGMRKIAQMITKPNLTCTYTQLRLIDFLFMYTSTHHHQKQSSDMTFGANCLLEEMTEHQI